MNRSYPEKLLHFVWQHRLYTEKQLSTDDNRKIEVLDPGLNNIDSGPDFFNAKIALDNGIVLAGNIEIHRTSDEWYRHQHHLDRAYNSVILHVVEQLGESIVNEAGATVPQVAIEIPEEIESSAQYLLSSRRQPPCGEYICLMPNFFINSLLINLALERLERKMGDILKHLANSKNSWDDVFYRLLVRNFGFGLNASAFELLADSLPLQVVRKHCGNHFQIEALLFGQAGLLNDRSIKCSYFDSLKREYNFLSRKYALEGIEQSSLRWLRVRPQSFPTVRLAQLAALINRSDRLFSMILEHPDPKRLRELFREKPSTYWQTHYRFGNISVKGAKTIGDASIDIILINTVCPLLFTYGKKMADNSYCNRAFEILTSIKPECNSIVRAFEKVGIKPQNAMDSQALIQLRKEYCDRRKCLFCRIGYQILSQTSHKRI